MSSNAQLLEDMVMFQLSETVKQRYAATFMESSDIYKTKQGHVLVTVVSVKKSPNMQRVAQVKAARAAGEFLEGVTNKSVTTYETIDNNSYSMTDKAEENSSTHNSGVSSDIKQNVSDITARQTEERFSDKVVQSSLTRVGNMSPLCRFTGEDGMQMFAYYLILK